MENYQVVIIGGGPAGYVAAIRLAQLGKKVAIIEQESLGGICLNWGCIPTKFFLKSAELFNQIKSAENYGISVSKVQYDIKKIINQSRIISTQLVKGIESLLDKNKVVVIKGTAKLQGKKIVLVNDNIQIRAGSIIIATGARAKVLDSYKKSNNDSRLWTYKEALSPKYIPKSILIVGSGAIGVEFASFYNSLGSKVTVLESLDRILPSEDNEISMYAQKILEKKGIKFYTKASLNNYDSTTISFSSLSKKYTISPEVILMAIGITGNVENIGLENTKIKVVNGHIETNSFMETAESDVYAIGDVAGGPWLAHKASHEGIIVAEKIVNNTKNIIKRDNIPCCIYSFPQVASVGLTEKVAIELGYSIKVGRFPTYANGKSLIINDKEGIVKTIFNSKTGELLGAHIVASEATEMIQAYIVGKTMEATELDFMNVIFPHPTLSEMLYESVLQAYNKSIHI